MTRSYITTRSITPGYEWTVWLGYSHQTDGKALETATEIVSGWGSTEAEARERAKRAQDKRF